MNSKYLVDKVHEGYSKRVIPLIEKGKYVEASIAVNNLVTYVNQKQERSEIMAFVKMGGSYIVALDQLLDRIKEGNKEDIETAMRSLEDYYAQTKDTKASNLN